MYYSCAVHKQELFTIVSIAQHRVCSDEWEVVVEEGKIEVVYYSTRIAASASALSVPQIRMWTFVWSYTLLQSFSSTSNYCNQKSEVMENKERRVLDGGGGVDDIDDAADDVEETTVFLDNRDLEQRKRLEVTAASSSTSPAKRTTNSQKEQQRAMSEKDVSFDGR